jgi:putative nucleotidyltransferase with HDIG domain
MASSAKELYRNADMAVYMAKRNGKNSVQIFSNDLDRRDSRNSSEYKSGYGEHADTVYALTATIDAKDHYTFRHSQNVAYYATELAKAAGMTPDVVEIVREAGLLHDIGKISITEDILNKTGKLSSDEYEIMKGHVESAVNIIHHLPSLDYVIPAVYSHHERYDGHGYPRRLAGDNIPITGRILCIADSFDAITSNRTYKEAISVPEALDMMRAESAGQFDPRLVDIFIDLVENGDIELRTEFSEPISVTNR